MTLYLRSKRPLVAYWNRRPMWGVISVGKVCHTACANALRIALLIPLAACGIAQEPPTARSVPIHQTWQIQPGSAIAGHRVLAGLGDISIDLAGGRVYAPFDGQIQPTAGDCVVFSSPEVPAYLLRLCGLRRPSLGKVREGQPLGRGEVLHFAALRKQTDGRWALVEPSAALLTRLLQFPQGESAAPLARTLRESPQSQ
ncbi:hypothetical protein HNI00_10605 [Thermoleptolyngbya oregonensis NK1-22]|uniref:Uncharacterized protein n=2 Tax=Thermoleptolyngbya TaxID=2303528 RepID=A0AA97BCX3_9CYAN|nr:hypothetical protein HNI00_10605 [Thermoleptolyngbya oregonensis NK1-22]